MGYLATLSSYNYPLPPIVPVSILECISRVDKSAVSQILEPFSVIFFNGPESETYEMLTQIVETIFKLLSYYLNLNTDASVY